MLFPSTDFVAVLADSQPIRHVLFRASLLLIGLMFLGLIVVRVRRWRTSEEDTSHSEPWTLQDLRDLRAAGELSEEEFGRLKAAMIAQYKQKLPESAGEGTGDGTAEECGETSAPQE
jgi:hypothetical protein